MAPVERYHVRFPATIDATPSVTLKASDAQLPMEPVVPSIGTGAAVTFGLQRMALTPTAAAYQCIAARRRAWPGWLCRHFGLTPTSPPEHAHHEQRSQSRCYASEKRRDTI